MSGRLSMWINCITVIQPADWNEALLSARHLQGFGIRDHSL